MIKTAHSIKTAHFDRLSKEPGLLHFQTLREGGCSTGSYAGLNLGYSTGDDPAAVLRNREMLATHAGIEARQFVFPRQVHGCGIAVVTAADRGRGLHRLDDAMPRVDALVTDNPGTALCITTADCIPVLCYDPVKRIVAAVHAGWRGTAARIAAETVGLMGRLFHSNPADILAGIGAGAGFCCYEVDETVAAALRRALPGISPAQYCKRKKTGGKYLVDLKTANRIQLETAGVLPENIEINPDCTICRSETYYSMRGTGGKGYGLSVSCIMLKE